MGIKVIEVGEFTPSCPLCGNPVVEEGQLCGSCSSHVKHFVESLKRARQVR